MFFAYPVAYSLIALLSQPAPAGASPCMLTEATQPERIVLNAEKHTSIFRRTVYDPQIMRPAQGDTWHVDSWVEVIWNTSGVPTNSEGKIVLGHIESGSLNEHLDINHPLASGFQLATGSIKVHVPDVESRDDYVVVLFGDSGNKSGAFSIAP